MPLRALPALAALALLVPAPAAAGDSAVRIEGPALFRTVCLETGPGFPRAPTEIDAVVAASAAREEKELDLAHGTVRLVTAGPLAVALRRPDRDAISAMSEDERAGFEVEGGPLLLTDGCSVAAFEDRRTMLTMIAQGARQGDPLQLPNFMSTIVPGADKAPRDGVRVTIERTVLGDGRSQWRREIAMDGIGRIWTLAVELE